MDQGSSLNNLFDFNSQAGVMTLLASIRASSLSPADKNELRDLVFLYTNGGGDVSVRIALEQKLVTHKIQPVASKAFAKPAILAFGSSRPAPIFKVPVNQASAPAAALNPTPVAAAAPIVQPPVTPVPVPSVVASPLPVVEPQAVPVPLATVAPVAAPLTGATSTNYLDRIREIKVAVNTKVGNPVNLVDINNEVGREYMNALLEAMKRLSGGVAGQIDVAMQRLETAYQAVEVAVAAHKQINVTAQDESSPIVKSSQVDASTPATVVEPVVLPVVQAPVVQNNSASEWTAPAAVLAETAISPSEEVVSGFATAAPVPATPTPVPDYVPPIVPSAPQIASLADEQKIHTPQDLPTASSIATSASGDPYKTREIDDGLEQLLSDWTLFKKSGLFGTGPHGREHPLFKKIAGLQIPLVLAGRFEGSTQEIKQSITDYMNGWRYEQGIIYEQGETFEHYLRRVIKQILDLQKKRKPA